MKRKEFLATSGMMITAALLTGNVMKANTQPTETRSEKRRPDPDQFDEPILKALTYSLNAPNPHNTQAWKFKVLNEKEVLFFVDETRLLPATDPPARQIHIGCGSFIAVFRMAARSLGFEAKVDYLPEGSYTFSEIGSKPVARLALVAGSASADPLFKHIYSRQTNRANYHGSLVSNSEFDTIQKLAQQQHADVSIINTADKLDPLLKNLYRGMEVECYDWNAYDESRVWFRVKDDIAAKKDGINLRVNGIKGIKRWIAEAILSGYSKKAWHDEGSIVSYLKSHYDAVMSSKGVVTFTTATNELPDWLKAGEDYARFQFAAYDSGFYIHPLSQVLQEFPSMNKLNAEFNQLVGVQAPAKVQMVVRIGRGKPLEYSYRRNTRNLIQR